MNQQYLMKVAVTVRSDVPVVQFAARGDGFDMDQSFVGDLEGLTVKEKCRNGRSPRRIGIAF
jgi:hypothetical protein